MLGRLATLRLRLLVVMIATGALAIGASYFAIGAIQRHQEIRVDTREAKDVALAAARARNLSELRLVQAALPDDQILYYRGGTLRFAGPRLTREIEATATQRFPGGSAVVREQSHGRTSPLVFTFLVAAVILVVIAAAVLAATLVARSIREPLARAIAASERVAAGDFTARMGAAGPEELAQLGSAFDAMAERLEQADLDQRRFLADIAHEIGTPIGSVAGFAGALADGTAASPDERAEAAQMIARDSERLRALLRDLRTLTRLDLLETVNAETVQAARFCAELAARLQPLARERGVTLAVRAERMEVVADPRLLEHVLVNLLTNALRYTPMGGRVDLIARRGNRRDSVFAVRDTGIGIAEEHRSKIFDRLYRTDEARARDTGGSGIGLSIAQRATRALGGRLELDSEPGRGSEFRLVLPRQDERLRGSGRELGQTEDAVVDAGGASTQA